MILSWKQLTTVTTRVILPPHIPPFHSPVPTPQQHLTVMTLSGTPIPLHSVPQSTLPHTIVTPPIDPHTDHTPPLEVDMTLQLVQDLVDINRTLQTLCYKKKPVKCIFIVYRCFPFSLVSCSIFCSRATCSVYVIRATFGVFEDIPNFIHYSSN